MPTSVQCLTCRLALSMIPFSFMFSDLDDACQCQPAVNKLETLLLGKCFALHTSPLIHMHFSSPVLGPGCVQRAGGGSPVHGGRDVL